MNYIQMHERIDVLLDKHDLPWFQPQEKDIFLNMAVNEFVKSRYSEFELNEKRREDLRTLVSYKYGNDVLIYVPQDFLFSLSVVGVFEIYECNNIKIEERSIKPVQLDDYYKVTNDPFNKASNKFPVYIITPTGFLIKSDSNAKAWTLTYLKKPNVIDGTNKPYETLNLPEHTHDEIINIAVRKLLFSIGQETYTIQANEIKEQE